MAPVTPDQIVAQARGWLGVPFRHQGRTAHGIDCVGLPIIIGQTLGLVPKGFEVANYGRVPSGELLQRLQAHCTQLPKAVPGSLILIAWTRTAAHVAICAGETMIHAHESVGRVVEHGYRGRWLRLTHSVWALPGVTYE
jgi:cell wall-associated NlpC family hydrolase